MGNAVKQNTLVFLRSIDKVTMLLFFVQPRADPLRGVVHTLPRVRVHRRRRAPKKISLSPPVAARFSCSGSTVAQSADPTSSWRFNSSRPDSRGFYYFITRFDCQSITFSKNLEIFYFNFQSYIIGRLLFIHSSLIRASRMSLLFNLMLILTDFKLNFIKKLLWHFQY